MNAIRCSFPRTARRRTTAPRARKPGTDGMVRALWPCLLALLLLPACHQDTSRAGDDADRGAFRGAADFDRLLQAIERNYAYLPDSGCDLGLLNGQLRPRAQAAADPGALIPVLESALECLHDPHAHLGANLSSSTRLIPSALDAWAEWHDGRAVVTQVRHDSGAWHAGIRRGDRILAIDGRPVDEAIERRLPCCISGEGAILAARQWTLLALLAGRHDQQVSLRVESAPDEPREVRFEPHPPRRLQKNVDWASLPDGSGYIAVNDLGDDGTVAAFDEALEALRGHDELFLDLRNTAAGGHTGVAEPILGRLIARELPYQRIVPMSERPWLRKVAPRGPWQYTGRITVLVSRWTGSMGEGMAIGLDAMERATVCGSRMAGLKGAVFEHRLPVSGIAVRLPGERLTHPDGRPREDFLPPRIVADAEAGHAAGDRQDWIAASVAACRGGPSARHGHGSPTR